MPYIRQFQVRGGYKLHHNSVIIVVNSKNYKVLYCSRGRITEGIIFKGVPVYFLIHEEDMNIRSLMIPKCSISAIPNILEQEFAYEFNDVSNIINCYEIINKQPKILELLLYYFKIDKMPIIKEYLNNGKFKVKGIFSSQFLIFNHYRRKVSSANYLLIYEENSSLYLIGVLKNMVHKSSIIDISKDKETYMLEINRFLKEFFNLGRENEILQVYQTASSKDYENKWIEAEGLEMCSITKLTYKGILELAAREV